MFSRVGWLVGRFAVCSWWVVPCKQIMKWWKYMYKGHVLLSKMISCEIQDVCGCHLANLQVATARPLFQTSSRNLVYCRHSLKPETLWVSSITSDKIQYGGLTSSWRLFSQYLGYGLRWFSRILHGHMRLSAILTIQCAEKQSRTFFYYFLSNCSEFHTITTCSYWHKNAACSNCCKVTGFFAWSRSVAAVWDISPNVVCLREANSLTVGKIGEMHV